MGEFGTALFTILAFNKAEEFGINAGIAAVLLPLSGIFVSLASYFMYHEKLHKTQILGLFIILAGATIISLFPAEDTDSGKKASSDEMMQVLLFSLLATSSLSLELTVSKVLAKKGVDGKYIGFNFLLAEGTLGSLCLLVTTLDGEGFYAISAQNFWFMLAAGLTGVIAVSLL